MAASVPLAAAEGLSSLQGVTQVHFGREAILPKASELSDKQLVERMGDDVQALFVEARHFAKAHHTPVDEVRLMMGLLNLAYQKNPEKSKLQDKARAALFGEMHGKIEKNFSKTAVTRALQAHMLDMEDQHVKGQPPTRLISPLQPTKPALQDYLMQLVQVIMMPLVMLIQSLQGLQGAVTQKMPNANKPQPAPATDDKFLSPGVRDILVRYQERVESDLPSRNRTEKGVADSLKRTSLKSFAGDYMAEAIDPRLNDFQALIRNTRKLFGERLYVQSNFGKDRGKDYGLGLDHEGLVQEISYNSIYRQDEASARTLDRIREADKEDKKAKDKNGPLGFETTEPVSTGRQAVEAIKASMKDSDVFTEGQLKHYQQLL